MATEPPSGSPLRIGLIRRVARAILMTERLTSLSFISLLVGHHWPVDAGATASLRTLGQRQTWRFIGMVNLIFGKLPRGITTVFRALNPDPDDRSFASHPQAISGQSFLGVIRFFLHPAVEFIQPIERHRFHPRNRRPADSCLP